MLFYYKLVPAALRSKAKVAYTNHSGAWNGEWPEIESTLKRRYFQEWFDQVHADCVFVLNESTRNNLIDHLGVDPSKIFVLGNGVDTSLYRPLVQIDCLRESEILFEKGCRYLFQCGSICPNKGQLRSLKVLAPFMENDKSLCFAYAGGIIDQSYADEIDAFCKSKGIDSQVRYVGELKPGKELASLYGGAIGFLFPSEYEAFGMALLEAMSCGIPVIRNDSARAFRFATEGEGFFSFDSDSEFGNRIKEIDSLNRAERDELTASARAFVENNYSWDVIASKYSMVFDNNLQGA